MMIGEKIRDSRKEKGLSMTELAEKASVTAGYISQIERNQIEPSLSVLRRISKILEVPLPELFAAETSGDVQVIPKNKRTIVKFPELNMAYEFLTPSTRNIPDLQMNAVCFRLEPKNRGSEGPITHKGDELIYVIRGELDFYIEGITYKIEEGGTLYIPKGTAHEFYNPGDITAEGIGVVTPAVY